MSLSHLTRAIDQKDLAEVDRLARELIPSDPELGMAAFAHAARHKRPTVLRELAKHVDVNASYGAKTPRAGLTALHAAAIAGDPDCVRALLDLGANPLARDASGKTPLHWAVHKFSSLNFSCAQALVNAAPESPRQTDQDGLTPLGQLASHAPRIEGNAVFESVLALLLPLSDVNAANSRKDTPLFFAAQAWNANLVEALLEAGADPCAQNGENNTPAMVAAAQNTRDRAAEGLACVRALARRMDLKNTEAGAQLLRQAMSREPIWPALVEFLAHEATQGGEWAQMRNARGKSILSEQKTLRESHDARLAFQAILRGRGLRGPADGTAEENAAMKKAFDALRPDETNTGKQTARGQASHAGHARAEQWRMLALLAPWGAEASIAQEAARARRAIRNKKGKSSEEEIRAAGEALACFERLILASIAATGSATAPVAKATDESTASNKTAQELVSSARTGDDESREEKGASASVEELSPRKATGRRL